MREQVRGSRRALTRLLVFGPDGICLVSGVLSLMASPMTFPMTPVMISQVGCTPPAMCSRSLSAPTGDTLRAAGRTALSESGWCAARI